MASNQIRAFQALWVEANCMRRYNDDVLDIIIVIVIHR